MSIDVLAYIFDSLLLQLALRAAFKFSGEVAEDVAANVGLGVTASTTYDVIKRIVGEIADRIGRKSVDEIVEIGEETFVQILGEDRYRRLVEAVRGRRVKNWKDIVTRSSKIHRNPTFCFWVQNPVFICP
jgi:hypothetical protein